MPVIARIGHPNDALPGAPSRLLETKLFVPQSHAEFVARPRLIARLREVSDHKLTLVVAPAGFGKSSLLASWLAGTEGGTRVAAWVSLDAGDNEPTRFWSYVVKALQKAHPSIGDHALAQLQSHNTPPLEDVVTSLINEVERLDEDVVLVLDDYHVIDAPPVHRTLAFLLDHQPVRMHVVIASRAEPPLPLSRLRARGELAELRATDLRFTQDEATYYLNRVMSLSLSTSDAETLERRTEGWIAGLKLAALSMQRRSDTRGFVDAFSGDNRYIADYLVDEILAVEGEVVRRFLLGTAMLDRLSGPLCDAVLDTRGSQEVLETLERRGLFVVALDDRREWYRYHHLFADVLQAQALRENPELARSCQRRASVWYEQNGSAEDAVRHALGAQDYGRAAGMLESSWPEKDRSYESARWLDRVRSLPDEYVRVRPVLSMGYAWALLNGGEIEAAESRLSDVERWLAEAEHPAGDRLTTKVVTDEARFRTLPIEVASARVYQAQSRGQTTGSVEEARRALALVPETDLVGRSTGTALVALAYWAEGELESAYRTFASALNLMRESGNLLSEVRGTFVLADIRVIQGRLREACEIYERGLRLAAEQGRADATESDELELGLAELDREWNDLANAHRRLQGVPSSAERTAHASNRQRCCIAMASVAEAEGKFDEALSLLDKGATYEIRSPIPRFRPIEAMKIRLRIAQERLADAEDWVRARNLSVNDAVSFAREFEHLTLVRLLIARHELGADSLAARDALRFLERLRSAAESAGRRGSLIEILVLEARAQHALGDARSAMSSLTRALEIGEPEGYVRVFADHGRPVRDLLRHAAARGLGGEYVRRILTAFDPQKPSPTPPPADVAGSLSSEAPQQLTVRELEVLRLIAAGLRNQEIATQLAITSATVKRHVANAYAKLGAGHRTEAIVRAKELKLL